MNINEIVSVIAEKINASTDLPAETKAVTAFDSVCEALPIDRYYVVLSGAESDSRLFENENRECCQKTQTVISMNCYAALDRTNVGLNTLAFYLSDMLMSFFEGKMTGYNIGSVYVEDSMKLFCLPCKLTFDFEQCPASVTADSVLKPYADFLCKTHVNDAIAHLTASEKAYVNEPFVVGSYSGSGDGNSQVIDVGFYPKFVLAFASGTPLFSVSSEKNASYIGVAGRSRSSMGISLQSGGFRVTQSETYSSKGVYPKLNELNTNYAYIAFK